MRTVADDLADSIWKFFSSLKLTIFLLIGLAAVSIIGTVIPQKGSPAFEKYLHSVSVAKFHLYYKLDFFDMYHSWWFTALLGLLCMNLIACSLRRLPRDWKSITSPPMVLDEALERSLPFSKPWKTRYGASEMERKVSEFLGREFAAPHVTRVGKEVHLFAQKGRYGRVGVYVLHLSIIIIFIGVIIGSLFGLETYAEIPEGGSITTVVAGPGDRKIELGYTLRCDSFSVSYYETGVPKEFKSVLSIIEKGRTVVDKSEVIVNRPLTYRGVTFYQSGYSTAGPPSFHFSARERATGSVARVTARQGETVSLPNGDSLKPLEFIPEVRPNFPHASGPAVLAELIPRVGEHQTILLLQRYPDFDSQRGGALAFTFDSVDEAWITGLKVVRDPGVIVVWIGCFLLVGGLITAFFLSNRRIWVRIADGRAVMAGNAGRNQAAFKDFLVKLSDNLKELQ